MPTLPIAAHHGTNVSYDRSKPTQLTGSVTEFVWSNPHCQLYFDVKDAAGKVPPQAVECERKMAVVLVEHVDEECAALRRLQYLQLP